MVGKKFGDKAETVARKLVHRMAPDQLLQGITMRESKQYAKKQLTEGTITTEIDVPCSVDGKDLDSSLVEIDYSIMYDGEIDYESVTCVDTGEDLLDAFMSLPQHEIDQIESKIYDYEEDERGESVISRWESDRNHTDEMDWTESRARSGRMMSESTNRKKPMLSESVSARHTDSAAIARIKQLSGLKK